MQLVVLFTTTVLFDPAPFPSIIILVPPEGEGVTEGLGVAVGEPLGEGVGLELGFTEGEADGVEDGEDEGEAEGLGKLAAALNTLFILEALLENNPKTDWLSANIVRQIKKEDKK